MPVDHELIERFADLAREAGAILAVPFLEAAGAGVHNAVILLDPAGDRIGVYRKQMLWPSDPHLGTLEGGVVPGSGGGPFRTPWGAVGVRVCLEVQYPGTWEDLATQGVPLILFPSEQAGGSALSARAWQTRDLRRSRRSPRAVRRR